MSMMKDLLDAIDSAPYICLLSAEGVGTAPLAYGPYSPEVAMEFCDRYNKWNAEYGRPEAIWHAVPLLSPSLDLFPTAKD